MWVHESPGLQSHLLGGSRSRAGSPGYLTELGVWWNLSSVSSVSSFFIKASS